MRDLDSYSVLENISAIEHIRLPDPRNPILAAPKHLLNSPENLNRF